MSDHARSQLSEPWMRNYCCVICEEEIQRFQPVIVTDMEYVDRLEGPVAKIVHEACQQKEEATRVVGVPE